MKSFRSKPVGWRGESHRHYLASKGVKTKDKKYLIFIGDKKIHSDDETTAELIYDEDGKLRLIPDKKTKSPLNNKSKKDKYGYEDTGLEQADDLIKTLEWQLKRDYERDE